ncbi:crossover junction endodeoxyribonuclease RuvC [Paenibacillus turicensis]|uniref:Crossover junction endodeoxyribonuclease RuvC n=1 Tax=Paenibacillus turicensis TaxID=160487 RepID=A0ABS4FYZ5_9BACL|nr:hypothetical protein [Paenibacillus turicensis]MBP1907796.1 crossover junction endodeoxyribonuclease RuvC [Paenibacillus turicensis]
MRFVGIDPSTKTGVVVIDENGAVLHELEIELENGMFSTVAQIQDYGREIARYTEGADVTCIEGFSFASKGKGVSIQYGVGFAVRFACRDVGSNFLEIPPSQVKKFATGIGNISKDNMVLPIFKKWKYEHESDNVRDAFILAQIARSITMGTFSYKYQLEVLESILAPSEKVTKKKGGKGNGNKQRAVCNS